MMQMPRLMRNRPAPLCTARNPTRTEASKQLTAQLERHRDPYLGGLEPASYRALPDDDAAALARMASHRATLEAIRKLWSALLATPILHIPVYHSRCAAARMKHDNHQRSRSRKIEPGRATSRSSAADTQIPANRTPPKQPSVTAPQE